MIPECSSPSLGFPLACAGRVNLLERPADTSDDLLDDDTEAGLPSASLLHVGKAHLAGSIVSQRDQEASKIDFTTLCPVGPRILVRSPDASPCCGARTTPLLGFTGRLRLKRRDVQIAACHARFRKGFAIVRNPAVSSSLG